MTTILGSANHIFVIDFGAKPNSMEDATSAIARAISAAKGKGATIEFAPGEYHFYREHGTDRDLFLSNTQVANPRKIAILIERQKDIHLKGNGAKLVFHDRIIPFALLGCRSVSLEGFTVDWDRPLMSQGTVVDSNTSGFSLKLDPEKYPYEVEQERLFFTDKTWKRRVWAFMEFDPKTGGVAPGTGDAGFTDGDWSDAKILEIEPGVVRFDYTCSRFPKVGNYLVARHGVRDHAGTFILDSKDIKLSNLAYRHTSGLGILSQYSENLTFDHVDVAPDPMSGRLFAGHDDGLHFSNCKGNIHVEGCKFEGLMDDPINVHGTAVRVVEQISDRSLRCRFMHNESVGLRFADERDSISFIDHDSMASRALGKVASIKHTSTEEFEITFVDPVPKSLKIGDALENLTWTPAFTVRNSVFGRVRARGLLVSTPKKVLVEDCVFRSSGAAILIAGDANGWYESGAVSDVTIRRNRFENCNSSAYQFGDAVISVHPEIPKLGSKQYHHGIRIERNRFETFDAPILWAKSVRDLTFCNNEIVRSNAFHPLNPDQASLTFIGCDRVRVEGNKLDPHFIGKGVRIESEKPGSVLVNDWK